MSAKSSKNNTTPQALSLSELSRKIKGSLNDTFAQKVWVKGEISEIHQHSSGHVYLELVEKGKKTDKIAARLKANIWSFNYRMLRPYFEGSTGYELTAGIKIMVLASIEYHPLYSISLNISDIDPAYTLGDLAQKKEEIIRQLVQEGVMDMNKEIDLPLVSQRIAVLSSESAAGYEDFLKSLENNMHDFHFHIHLFPALMQGVKAVESIIKMLEEIYEHEEDFDLVVIIRGGGAKLDLECFNNYDLAYHITQFPLPVLTGIGHERDETIADLVAHTKLKTPTAVAEFLIDSMSSFLKKIDFYQERILNFTGNKIHVLKSNLNKYSYSLFELVNRNISAYRYSIEKYKIEAENKSKNLLAIKNSKLDSSQKELKSNSQILLREEVHKLNNHSKSLKLLDPVNILKRGFSISFKNGELIKNSDSLANGDEIQTKFYKGKIKSRVIKK